MIRTSFDFLRTILLKQVSFNLINFNKDEWLPFKFYPTSLFTFSKKRFYQNYSKYPLQIAEAY